MGEGFDPPASDRPRMTLRTGLRGYSRLALSYHNLSPFQCYGFGHVTTSLGTWRTHGYLLYLVALLPLSLFFRFVVLV